MPAGGARRSVGILVTVVVFVAAGSHTQNEGRSHQYSKYLSHFCRFWVINAIRKILLC